MNWIDIDGIITLYFEMISHKNLKGSTLQIQTVHIEMQVYFFKK